MKFKITKPVRLDQGTPKQKQEEIKQYFLDTFELSDRLFSLLKDESAFYKRPNPLRHPLIFYYGHTATFFVNKLYAGKFISERINPTLESMLAIGVDEMSWDDLNESHYNWPPVSAVRAYREKVKELVVGFIDQIDLTLPIGWESSAWPILMGIEHQRIHIETSSVLIRELDLSFVNENSDWPICTSVGAAPLNEMLPAEGGFVEIGKSFSSPYYGWDNEYGSHQKTLQKFAASKYLVSNGEFLDFVQDSGYQHDQWWSEEGRKWKAFSQARQPHFWRSRGAQTWLRVIDREIPLPLNWPVEVNQLEAHAFCQWKSKKLGESLRLPTEDEWYSIYNQEQVAHLGAWATAPGNINLEHFGSSCPVDQFKAMNFYDVIGNVWQWTETPIYPFEGFKVHWLYDDFTVPTFDQRHNLIKGGSWISTGNEALAESRYAFRRHFFQHAGFRYVNSSNPVEIQDNPYETDAMLSQYCEFHYGDQYFGVPNFPKACIEYCANFFDQLPGRSQALDLGCAVGRSTFELSRYFDHVTGLDLSARFIEVAQRFTDTKSIGYLLPTEGDLTDPVSRNFDSLNLGPKIGEVQFSQADACNLAKKHGGYDFIFCGNLIDRLRSPRTFLRSIHSHLNPGGMLVIASPYTWLEDYTPKTEWIGGYKRDGENLYTLKGLEEELAPWFERIGSPHSIPFVIRETRRKFQHSLSEVTVWKKRH